MLDATLGIFFGGVAAFVLVQLAAYLDAELRGRRFRRRPVPVPGLDASLDSVRRVGGDTSPLVAQDVGPHGPRWWSRERVYCADLEERRVVSVPRHPHTARERLDP